MAQEFVYANASISGDANTPSNAHGTSDGTFTTDIDNEDWTHRWGFDNPTASEVDNAVDAIVRLTVRKWDGTGTPTIDSIQLFDSTGSIVTDATGWSVNSASSEQIVISGLSLASLTDLTGDSIEIEIITTAQGGSPGGRAAVQVDEIRLELDTANVTHDTALPAVTALAFTVDAPTIQTGWQVVPAVTALAFTVDAPTVGAGSGVIPDTTALAFTVDAPTIGAGSGVIPDTIPLAFTVEAVTIQTTSNATVIPAAIALAFTVDAVTVVTASDDTALPGVLDIVLTIPAVTVNTFTDATVIPDTIALAFTVDAPTVGAGSSVAPAATPITLAVPAVTIVAGSNATVTPAVTALAFTVDAPTIQTGWTATPADTPITLTIPAVTIQVTTNATATPGVIALAIVIPAVTVVTGGTNATVTPAPIELDWHTWGPNAKSSRAHVQTSGVSF